MNKVEIAKDLAKCFNESSDHKKPIHRKRLNEAKETSLTISKSELSAWIDKISNAITDGAANNVEVDGDTIKIGTINGKAVELEAQNLLSNGDYDFDDFDEYSIEDMIDTIGYPVWFSLQYVGQSSFADLEPDDASNNAGDNADKIIALFNKEAKTGSVNESLKRRKPIRRRRFNESSKKHVLYAQPADDNSGSRFAEHEFSTKDDLKKIFEYYYRNYLIAWYGLRYERTLDQIIDSLMEKEDGEYLYTWVGEEGDAADFGALAEDFEVGKYFGLTEEHYEDGKCVAGNMFTKLYVGVDDFANGFD